MIEQNAEVSDALDLTQLGRISGTFSCRSCIFRKRFSAAHTVFARGIDLSGSIMCGRVDFRGARFEDAAIFGRPPLQTTQPDTAPTEPCSKSRAPSPGRSSQTPGSSAPDQDGAESTTFDRPVDLSFATFDDFALFWGASFHSRADFTSARFRMIARFGGTTFNDGASFDGAVFSDDSSFAGASVTGATRFAHAAFEGVADFRGAQLTGGESNFADAVFRGRAEFSRATLEGGADFSDARFGGDALFLATNLPPSLADAAAALTAGTSTGQAVGTKQTSDPKPAVNFDEAVVNGRLDLNGALLLGGSADLRDVSAQWLSLDEITYGDSSSLLIDGLTTSDASMDLHDVPHVSGSLDDEARLLHRAEDTAKAARDLRLANDLHYQIQELASSDDPWPRRALDLVFYRGAAGYLVRPLRPLYCLLGLVLLAALIRALRLKWPPRPPKLLLERVAVTLVGATRALVVALLITVKPRPIKDLSTLRQLELTVYVVLLACFTLALANTNPTLRDMVNTVI